MQLQEKPPQPRGRVEQRSTVALAIVFVLVAAMAGAFRLQTPHASCINCAGQRKAGETLGICPAQVCARLRTVHAACRCLKFGEGPADLMAFSEHSDLCHLVDTRAFQERQVSMTTLKIPLHK